MGNRTEETDERVDNRPSDTEKSGWAATLEELHALADERRAEGWTVLPTQAGDTALESPDVGDTDQFGLVYVVPGDDADRITDLFDTGAVDEYETYRQTVGGTCFLLTELRDTANRSCVIVAGAYEVVDAEPLASHATEVGHVFTRIQRLDGSQVAEIRHEAYEKLFPPSLFE